MELRYFSTASYSVLPAKGYLVMVNGFFLGALVRKRQKHKNAHHFRPVRFLILSSFPTLNELITGHTEIELGGTIEELIRFLRVQFPNVPIFFVRYGIHRRPRSRFRASTEH